MKHYSVMLSESIDLLDVKRNGLYIDGTLGRGGHSIEILKRLKEGQLYVFDLDEEAIKESKERLKDYQNVTYIHDNYANVAKYVKKETVDGIILDLGVSSPQLDDEKRGFSYRFDTRLDMRMDKEAELSAYEVVNEYSLDELKRIIYEYGEERYAPSIAKNIVKRREERPIETTFELVKIIKASMPAKQLSQKGHPAKQTFQAIRIEVNKELSSLKKFLKDFPDLLKVGGRASIITFHSLEDRMVKQTFKKLSSIKVDKRLALLPSEIESPRFELLNHKVITAKDDEIEVNLRSKSAKLRGIKKVR